MLDSPHRTPADPTLDENALALALSGHHFIGGRFVPARSGKTFPVVNPATGDEIGQAAEGDASDVEAAVADADRAQKDWAKLPARKRGALVAQCAALLNEHKEELARLIALETGKALRTESRVEAGVVADIFEFYGGLGGELKGETVPFAPNVLSVTVREPLGVVGAIIPWNVPMLLMALKVAPALVAGNTVVVKSAEEAPLTVLRVCELLNRVLPPGCFNMLSGFGPECGAPLVAHPKVRKVTFTGSVEVGRIVSKDAPAEKLVPVTLELGGKSPMLVFADCDFEQHGHGRHHLDALHPPGPELHRGQPHLRRAADLRPLRRRARGQGGRHGDGRPAGRGDRHRHHHQPRPVRQGAGLHRRGHWPPPAPPAAPAAPCPTTPRMKNGLFIRPHIFTNLPEQQPPGAGGDLRPGHLRLPVRRRRNRAPRGANGTEYGLAASLWTNNLKRGLDLAHRLEAGLVQINQNLVVQANLSYGGVKSSGLGKEASLESMLEHFMHKKTIMVNYAP